MYQVAGLRQIQNLCCKLEYLLSIWRRVGLSNLVCVCVLFLGLHGCTKNIFAFHFCKVDLCRHSKLNSYHTWSACQYTPVPISVPVTVEPPDAAIHIGLSDTPYTTLDATIAGLLSNCNSLPSSNLTPVKTKVDIECQCQSGVSGRYIYVYTNGVSWTNILDILDFQVYGDPTVEIRK